MSELHEEHCAGCEGHTRLLTAEQIRAHVTALHTRWAVNTAGDTLHATFSFDNYHETMAFLNAVAFIAHREDHHPDIQFGYNRVTMHWQTHAAGGITMNDLICAAKVDRLLV